MGALGELQAQLVRIAATSEGWQMMALYALLIALWWYLRRCRRSAEAVDRARRAAEFHSHAEAEWRRRLRE